MKKIPIKVLTPKLMGKNISMREGGREIYWFPINWLGSGKMHHLREKNWWSKDLEAQCLELLRDS